MGIFQCHVSFQGSRYSSIWDEQTATVQHCNCIIEIATVRPWQFVNSAVAGILRSGSKKLVVEPLISTVRVELSEHENAWNHQVEKSQSIVDRSNPALLDMVNFPNTCENETSQWPDFIHQIIINANGLPNDFCFIHQCHHEDTVDGSEIPNNYLGWW